MEKRNGRSLEDAAGGVGHKPGGDWVYQWRVEGRRAAALREDHDAAGELGAGDEGHGEGGCEGAGGAGGSTSRVARRDYEAEC